MSVTVYGMNHIALEVDDVETAVRFYTDVFGLEQQSGGEGEAFFKVRIPVPGAVPAPGAAAGRGAALRDHREG